MLDLDADFIKKEYQDGTTCCIVLAQLWDITTDAAISTPFAEFFKRINYSTDYLLKKTAIKTLSINIGDSRAMIITANAAYQNTLLTNPSSTQQIQQHLPLTPGAMKRRPEYIAITRDHKPSLDTEHQRIVNAMGSVSGNRVDGSLALSRAIGDAPFKNNPLLSPTQQKVIAVPDFELHTMYWGDSLLVCCDGIFEAEKMTYSGCKGFHFAKYSSDLIRTVTSIKKIYDWKGNNTKQKLIHKTSYLGYGREECQSK